jgi:N-acetylglutamate synthase-like GNAT family acetyltransferase
MNDITYKYIDHKSREFEQVINLRFDILFKPYNKIDKYRYDELDNISFHLVALHNNRVIGYSRMTSFTCEGKITNVVVDPEYTKRGIGVEMLKRHISIAEHNNIGYLFLNARLDTVGFYKKVGFKSKGDIFLSEKSGFMLQEMHYKVN